MGNIIIFIQLNDFLIIKSQNVLKKNRTLKQGRIFMSYIIYKGQKVVVKDSILDLSSKGIVDISEIINLETLMNLKSLDLSSNELIEIKCLKMLKNLETLDLTYNKITEINGLDELTNLKTLYLNSNKIEEIKGLDKLNNLKELSLAVNSISEIKGLDTLTKLEKLYLDNNKIKEIKGLEKLTNLKTLYLNDNKIEEIKGLNNLTNLEKLYLDNNKIEEIKGLDILTSLEKLFLNNNLISEIKGIEHLGLLTTLSLEKNPLRPPDMYILQISYNTRKVIEHLKTREVLDVEPILDRLFTKELEYPNNILKFKQDLKTLEDDRIFINIGTYEENQIIKAKQNAIFLQQPINPIEISKTNTYIKKIPTYLIQLHSFKGFNPSIEDYSDYFLYFIKHFWNCENYSNRLVYDHFESRVINKLREILEISIKHNNSKPKLIVFPENTIPYKYIDPLRDLSNEYNIIIIGGLEHKKDENSDYFINQAIIIDKGNINFQKKQTPVLLKKKNIKEYIKCERIPKINIFKTSIGNIAIFICKDFLRLCDVIPKWAKINEVEYIIIPSLTTKVLPFHTKLINLFNYTSNKELKIIFCNIGEYGGSEIFSIDEINRIEKSFQSNKRDNVGEVIVSRSIKISNLKQILRILQEYESIKTNEEKERLKTEEIGKLFDKSHKNLKELGFNILHDGDSINDDKFLIHLTRRIPKKKISQFLIRRLDKGQKKRPDELYFSEQYPKITKEDLGQNPEVIFDFIDYLSKKI